MAICIVSSTYPPFVCGVADYAARTTTALLATHDVTIFTHEIGGMDPALRGPGKVVQGFDRRPKSLMDVPAQVQKIDPDWLILQFEPFSYGGKYGINFYLPKMLRQVRRLSPRTRIAAVVHEGILPVISLKRAALRVAQVAQLMLLGRASDRVLFATQTWATRYGKYVGRSKASHFPIVSNIRRVAASRDEVRTELGITPNQFVICFFGRARPAKALYMVRAAAEKLKQQNIDPVVLYLGANGTEVKNELGDLPLITRGPLPGEEISRMLRAVDLYLVPLAEGVSTRRSSLLVAMDHGLPVLSTFGPETDLMLLEQNGKSMMLVSPSPVSEFADAAVLLAKNPGQRAQLGLAADAFFRSVFDESLFEKRLMELIGKA